MNEESLRAIRDLHTMLRQSVDPKPKKRSANHPENPKQLYTLKYTLKSPQHATTSKVYKHVNAPTFITFSRNKLTSPTFIPATTFSGRNTNKKTDSPKDSHVLHLFQEMLTPKDFPC